MEKGKDPELSIEEMQKGFRASKEKAEEAVKDEEKTQNILDESIILANRLKSGPLAQVWEDLQLLFSVIKDWITKEYREMPIGSIIAIVGALIYLISPIDIIPDFIPLIGYIDDVFILGLVINQIHADLQEYKDWKKKSEVK